MMKLTLLSLVSTMILVGGCATKKAPPPPTPVPMSADELASLRNDFTTQDPNVRVASVVEVDGDYARLGEANPADFPFGETVVIIDSSRNVLASGEIARSDGAGVDVRFATTGARAPAVGDAAVYFVRPDRR